MTQLTLARPEVKYSLGPWNKYDKNEQWIRVSEGCPHNCPWCYEPQERKWFGIVTPEKKMEGDTEQHDKAVAGYPGIIRNRVKIMDMNILWKPESLQFIEELGNIKVRGRPVSYEFICGIDYRFLTPTYAKAMKGSRFRRIRLAWDGAYSEQKRIKTAIRILTHAGYRPSDIMVFMICNHRVTSWADNCRKLDLCKVWNVKVADCWFDNQVSPNIQPIYWNAREIDDFRRRARKHNQLINFRCDPQPSINPWEGMI